MLRSNRAKWAAILFHVQITQGPKGTNPASCSDHTGSKGYQSCFMLRSNRVKWAAILFHVQITQGPKGTNPASSSNQTGSSGYQSFMLRSSQGQIMANYPDRYNDFSQFLQANARIVPTISPYPLPSTPLPPINPTPRPYLRVS